MPAYPYLFEEKEKPDPEERVVKLPPGDGPRYNVLVARQEAIDLVKYLQSLDRSYPVIEAPAAAATRTTRPFT
jgi:cytochrome c oxidase cbb3-type subunit 2